MVNPTWSTGEHQIEFFYHAEPHWYGVRCSCGERFLHQSMGTQNVELFEVLGWMAYKHTGKSGVQYPWSS